MTTLETRPPLEVFVIMATVNSATVVIGVRLSAADATEVCRQLGEQYRSAIWWLPASEELVLSALVPKGREGGLGAIAVGTVVNIRHNPLLDRLYTAPVKILRHAVSRSKTTPQLGTIHDVSNSHGTTYEVRTQDGQVAWFEREELEPVGALDDTGTMFGRHR